MKIKYDLKYKNDILMCVQHFIYFFKENKTFIFF